MGFHKLPAIANRLRVNRGFDSAWYTDVKDYAKVLQKDWLLSKTVASFVQRSSRSLPRVMEKRDQKMANLSKARQRIGKGVDMSEEAAMESAGAADSKIPRDFPNFRVGRVFLQHLPYKTYASTYAYAPPKDGPQAKYGIEKPVIGGSKRGQGK